MIICVTHTVILPNDLDQSSNLTYISCTHSRQMKRTCILQHFSIFLCADVVAGAGASADVDFNQNTVSHSISASRLDAVSFPLIFYNTRHVCNIHSRQMRVHKLLRTKNHQCIHNTFMFSSNLDVWMTMYWYTFVCSFYVCSCVPFNLCVMRYISVYVYECIH